MGQNPPRAASTQKVRKSRAETQTVKAIKGKPRGNRTGRQAGSQKTSSQEHTLYLFVRNQAHLR